jgi:hypothetical protein
MPELSDALYVNPSQPPRHPRTRWRSFRKTWPQAYHCPVGAWRSVQEIHVPAHRAHHQRGLSPPEDLRAEKLLKALDELFLGADNIPGCDRVGFSRGLVAEVILEANRALYYRFRVAPDKGPKEWYAT